MSLLDNLFVNLRVISKIPEGGRISTTGAGQIKIEDTKTLGGWLSTGRRSITGDSRDQAVTVLMKIINDVTEFSDTIIDSLNTGSSEHTNPISVLNENVRKCHQLGKLCTMLKNSKKGIVNLHQTYADDANVTARLDEVMDKIDQQQETISQVLEFMRNLNMSNSMQRNQNGVHSNQQYQSLPQQSIPVRYHQTTTIDSSSEEFPSPFDDDDE